MMQSVDHRSTRNSEYISFFLGGEGNHIVGKQSMLPVPCVTLK